MEQISRRHGSVANQISRGHREERRPGELEKWAWITGSAAGLSQAPLTIMTKKHG